MPPVGLGSSKNEQQGANSVRPPYQLNRSPPCRYTAAVVVETRQVTHLGIGCRRVRQLRAKSSAHAVQLPSRFGWNVT